MRDEMAGLIRREKQELVHVHNTFLMISPSCRDAGVPVVQTLHNYRLLCPAAIYCVTARPPTSAFAELSEQRHPQLPPELATAVLALMLAVHRMRQICARMVDRYIALSEFAAQAVRQ